MGATKVHGIEAGELRHRITIQVPGNLRDTSGGVVRSWISIGRVWVAIDETKSLEKVRTGEMQGRNFQTIRIRYHEGVTDGCRVLFGSRVFNIEGVTDTDDMHYEMVLITQEVSG